MEKIYNKLKAKDFFKYIGAEILLEDEHIIIYVDSVIGKSVVNNVNKNISGFSGVKWLIGYDNKGLYFRIYRDKNKQIMNYETI